MQIVISSPRCPAAGSRTVEVRVGYEKDAAKAADSLAVGSALGIPRYQIDIPSKWKKAKVVEAMEDPPAEHLVAPFISLQGTTISGWVELKGPPASAFLPAKNKRPSRPQQAAPGAPSPKATRGACRMISKRVQQNFLLRLQRIYSHPGQLVSRVIHATFAPRPGSKQRILKTMTAIRRELKRCCEEKGLYTLGKIAFAYDPQLPNEPKRPHWHCLIFLPQSISKDECAVLSKSLRTRIDGVWRKTNKFGLMDRAWDLKTDVKAVKNLIRYMQKHETHPNMDEHWGKPTFEFGTPPEPRTEIWTPTAEQYKKVWAALAVTSVVEAFHPWAVNFVFTGVKPRHLLMILQCVGVAVPPEQLEMYAEDW